MNNDYLDNQDKYMYGVCCLGGDEKDVYENTYYNTIDDALSAMPFLEKDSPAEVKIAVCERGGLVQAKRMQRF